MSFGVMVFIGSGLLFRQANTDAEPTVLKKSSVTEQQNN